MRSSSEVMKTKSTVRPSAAQRMVLNLELAELGAGRLEIGIIRLSDGCFSLTASPSTVFLIDVTFIFGEAGPQRDDDPATVNYLREQVPYSQTTITH
jgi:hypothetical protein